ncbi:hypothetical protein [Streptomyces sp. NPDC050856]|uniref:hypothetical protein n=1 Tax=Streptomyces sp. NPDC050856 TaxID=3154939 RepID=UPI0033CF142A
MTGSEADGLFDLDGLREAALAEARRAPIERWMTFLHPDQVALVRRDHEGPARISGPAGTGKTVVGLHRAAHLAQRTGGRVLYVTFANNLPRVQRTFLRAMAPVLSDRVDFRSLHSWAQEYLQSRGVPVRLHGDKAETAFSLAWKHVGRESCLAEIDAMPGYWREEIDYVIKGRGLTTFEEYAAVPRRRRRTVLRRTHRQAVWALYEAYERTREVDVTYHEGEVVRVTAKTLEEHDRALVDALRSLPPQARADTAVLCPSKGAIGHYQGLLTRAGLPVCLLEHYDGSPAEGVKLGSYRRAKGLEFKRVPPEVRRRRTERCRSPRDPVRTGTTRSQPALRGHDPGPRRALAGQREPGPAPSGGLPPPGRTGMPTRTRDAPPGGRSVKDRGGR